MEGMKKTSRGFDIYSEFIDLYGSNVRIQKSSIDGLDACWIFVENEGTRNCPDYKTDGAIHLDKKQAQVIIEALKVFCKGKT